MAGSLYFLDHYSNRLAAVIKYIEANLAAPLHLATLAEKASFSPNHFHKVFQELQGETPRDYVRRCRLERAAALLHYGHGLAVKDVARQCGYKSLEAFDRAFHAYFRMTPTEWRSGGHASQNKSLKDLSAISSRLSADQVEVKILPLAQVVYKRKIGPYSEQEAELWAALKEIVKPFGFGNQTCLGVELDDPVVTPENRCRFDACIKLPALRSVPVDLPVRLIPGGYHAVLPYSGPAGKTADHWAWLFEVWLPQSGFGISQHARFEHYPEGFPSFNTSVRSELCLPLAR